MKATPEILEAVNHLLAHDDAKALYGAIIDASNATAAHPDRISVQLRGDAAPLEPLLTLRQQAPAKFDDLLEWVAHRRIQHGLEGLEHPQPIEDSRAFMLAKRHRLQLAWKIQSLECEASPTDRMNAPQASALDVKFWFFDRTSSAWKAELDSKLERARAAKQKGQDHGPPSLSTAEAEQVRAEFWAELDERLRTQMAKLCGVNRITLPNERE